MQTIIKYVIYYRVSLEKQGRSGLGLEAQRAMFAAFLKTRPGTVVGEFTEVETGKTYRKSQQRPELKKAIDLARVTGATLVVAKIDRAARNVAFIAMLLESELSIVCCDLPEADRFTLHILAAVAEREGKMISERTAAALKVLKERGVALGSAREGHWDGVVKEGKWAGTPRTERRDAGLAKATAQSKIRVQEEMSKRYEPLVPWIREMREAGLTLRQIVAELNAKGCLTRRNKTWSLNTLRGVIIRYLGDDYLGYPGSKVRPCVAANGR